MGLKELFLYFNTIKYLKCRQIIYNFIRRFPGRRKFTDIKDLECHQITMMTPIKYKSKIDNESICFLNESRSFDYISDWSCMEEPKLWRYNLQYFDFLLDDGASIQLKDQLINSWLLVSQEAGEDAWEAYPVSLRIVNWIKYFIIYKNNCVPDAWLTSLYQQANTLYHSIEYHILANHYFKNAKGLLFAGAYIKCNKSHKWYEKGKSIITQEVEEQLFDDGGHYEKSPMYHSIVIEDCLDVINLLQSNNLVDCANDIKCLFNKTIKSLELLNSIIMPDGDIPLLNDAAFSISPNPAEIFEYANQVLGYENKEAADESIISLKDFGYYIIKDKQSMCIVDCGDISPSYQPGHTHCDLLSFELAIDGCRVIVDSGVYGYEDTEERQYCRSTAAHNTLMIDGYEQSELWGSFRVARRAKVISAYLIENDDGWLEFRGSYSPYWSGDYNISHSRCVKYNSRQWEFCDTVYGLGEHDINNFIHFHPDIKILIKDKEYYLLRSGEKLARITFSSNMEVYLEEGWYYPEFGIKNKNSVIRLYNKGPLPIKQKYQIEEL